MTKNIKLILLISIMALLTIFAFAFNSISSEDSDQPIVASTIFPIYDITNQLLGDLHNNEIKTTLILPPGASPHLFEISPRQMREIEKATRIFAIGHNLDDWITNISNENKITIVDTNINLIESDHYHSHGHDDHHDDHDTHHDDHSTHHADHTDHNDHHDDHSTHHADHADHSHHADHGHHDHDHGPIDPHYWLSPANGLIIAQNIAQQLQLDFPQFSDIIQENLNSYLAELQATYETTYTIINEVGNKNLLTLHDAWYYFAEAYNLNIVGTYTPSAGKEPLPQDLANLRRLVTEYSLETVYTEPQISTATLQAFIEDNNLQLATLDPLGGLPGRESYIDLLLYNANVLAGQP